MTFRAAVFATILLLLPTVPARAQDFDSYTVFGGLALESSRRMDARRETSSILGGSTVETASRQLDFAGSGFVAVRGLLHYGRASLGDANPPPRLLLGAGLDVAYLPIRASGVRIDAVPVSAVAEMRGTFARSDRFRFGRVQPFLGLGISAVTFRLRANLAPMIAGSMVGFETRPGLLGFAGLSVGLAPEVHLVFEARMVAFPALLHDGAFLVADRASVAVVSTQLAIGLSVRFERGRPTTLPVTTETTSVPTPSPAESTPPPQDDATDY